MEMTLNELSEIIKEKKGFGFDMFDMDIESDFLESCDIADMEGEKIINFEIVKLSPETGHLETIIKIDGRKIR